MAGKHAQHRAYRLSEILRSKKVQDFLLKKVYFLDGFEEPAHGPYGLTLTPWPFILNYSSSRSRLQCRTYIYFSAASDSEPIQSVRIEKPTCKKQKP